MERKGKLLFWSINKRPPIKGLNIRIPSITPIKGEGLFVMGLAGFGFRPPIAGQQAKDLSMPGASDHHVTMGSKELSRAS